MDIDIINNVLTGYILGKDATKFYSILRDENLDKSYLAIRKNLILMLVKNLI